MGRLAIDMNGQTFGHLTVVERSHSNNGYPNAEWICKCQCGNTHIVSGNNLRSGSTSCCGCVKPNIKHGKYRSPEWRAWKCMKQRCINPKNPGYRYWGGRGITEAISERDEARKNNEVLRNRLSELFA